MYKHIRVDINDCLKVKDESDIPGNFTSVIGEFKLPKSNKTAFYKKDGCMLAANNDESIRELLASEILDILEVPHAEITLAYDSNNQSTGCLSHSILKEDESFINNEFCVTPITDIESYVDREMQNIGRFQNVTANMINNRKRTVVNQIYINCLLNNCDIKPDNMQLIFNNKNGQIRSSECYDFGLAFSDENSFIYNKTYESMMQELYSKYYDEIKDLSECVKQRLTPEKLNEFLSETVYQEGFKGKLSDIINKLNDRVQLSNKYLDKTNSLNNNQTLSTEVIRQKCSDVSVSLKNSVSNFINNLLSRDKEGKEK